MRGLIRLNERFWVGPQPTEREIKELYFNDGLETLVNLKPEESVGEATGPILPGLTPEEEGRVAHATSLVFLHFPAATLTLTHGAVHAFLEVAKSLPEPMYFHAATRKLAGAMCLIAAAHRRGWTERDADLAATRAGLQIDSPRLKKLTRDVIAEVRPAQR